MDVVRPEVSQIHPELIAVIKTIEVIDPEVWTSLKVMDFRIVHFKFGAMYLCEEGHIHLGFDLNVCFSTVAAIARATKDILGCQIGAIPKYNALSDDEAVAAYARDLLLGVMSNGKASVFVAEKNEVSLNDSNV